MINLKVIQQQQKEWADRNFPGNSAWQPLLGVGEEVGELMHHFLKKSQGIRGKEDHDAEMEDAAGDIMIYLMNFCSHEGICLETALLKTWAKVSQRDWQKNPDSAHLTGEDLLKKIRHDQVRAGERAVMDNLQQLMADRRNDGSRS